MPMGSAWSVSERLEVRNSCQALWSGHLQGFVVPDLRPADLFPPGLRYGGYKQRHRLGVLEPIDEKFSTLATISFWYRGISAASLLLHAQSIQQRTNDGEGNSTITNTAVIDSVPMLLIDRRSGPAEMPTESRA